MHVLLPVRFTIKRACCCKIYHHSAVNPAYISCIGLCCIIVPLGEDEDTCTYGGESEDRVQEVILSLLDFNDCDWVWATETLPFIFCCTQKIIHLTNSVVM